MMMGPQLWCSALTKGPPCNDVTQKMGSKTSNNLFSYFGVCVPMALKPEMTSG